MKPEECPECGNKNLKMREQISVVRIVSVQTGKVLKDEGYAGTECWNYFCKCGWEGELETQ